jgi:hypothetical protein
VARKRNYTLAHSELNERLDAFLDRAGALYGNDRGRGFAREIVVSALRLLRDRAETSDIRLVSRALKELRHAFRVFRPYEDIRKVAIFGSARTPPGTPEWVQAHAFAQALAREGWMAITGAGGGIMEAAQIGAGREASFGVNIQLPFEQSANETILGDSKLINFRYFFTRKVTFVKEAHAIVLLPGGFGTLDEGFEALTLLQTGKTELLPVVFLDRPGGSYWRGWLRFIRSQLERPGWISPEDLSLFTVLDDVEEAVAHIQNFYSNYHSSRHVDGRLVLRVRVAPDPSQLAEINDEFSEMMLGEPMRIVDSSEEDATEDIADLVRLSLRFDRHQVGRLRELIDRLNGLVTEQAPPRHEAASREVISENFADEVLEALESEDDGPKRPPRSSGSGE